MSINASDLLCRCGLINFIEPEEISDGYHTFGELYDHRNTLFCLLLTMLEREQVFRDSQIWKSKLHADGTMFEGYFIAGLADSQGGRQITYHLPLKFWSLLDITEIPNSLEWDGHSSDDVLERLVSLLD